MKKTKFETTCKAGKAVSFSDFFLHAPEEKMQRVFKLAARRANSDQRKLYAKYRRKDL